MGSIDRWILVYLLTPLALLVISALLSPSLQRIMIIFLIYLILSISWITILKLGYVSLGTAAFYGLGMYLFMYLNISGLPPISNFVMLSLIVFLISLIIGYITMRLTGIFFILATFAFAEALRQGFIYIEMNFTGYIGKIIRDSLPIFDTLCYLSFILILASLVYYATLQEKVRIILDYIREDELLARVCGIKTLKYKLIIFSVASVIQALTGSLAAWYLSYIDPDIAFNPSISIQTLAIGLMGGTGHYFGPFLSAIILVLLSEQLIRIAPHLHLLVIGIVVIVFSRVGKGFSEVIEVIWRWFGWGK